MPSTKPAHARTKSGAGGSIGWWTTSPRPGETIALADTTFFIDLMAKTHGAVTKLDELVDLGEPLWVPSIALHELYYGAHLHAEADRETDRIRELERALPPVGFTPAASRIAGRIEASLQARGERPGRADVQIAAMAMARGEAVVTRDERFEAIEGLRVERYGSSGSSSASG